MARPWIDYIARNSFLLQQGRNVADVAYFYGEEQPLTALYALAPLADVPERYAYDFVNAEVLLNVLSVEDGELVARSGARYQRAVPRRHERTHDAARLQRIAALVEAGATVVGDAPRSPRPDRRSCRVRGAGATSLDRRVGQRGVGSGRVIAGRDVEAALASLGVAPDFSVAKPQPDSEVLFVHRRLDDGDDLLRQQPPQSRRTGRGALPRHRQAARDLARRQGRPSRCRYRIEGGETVVPLEFAAEDSFFVVFRKPATAASSRSCGHV